MKKSTQKDYQKTGVWQICVCGQSPGKPQSGFVNLPNFCNFSRLQLLNQNKNGYWLGQTSRGGGRGSVTGAVRGLAQGLGNGGGRWFRRVVADVRRARTRRGRGRFHPAARDRTRLAVSRPAQT